MQQTNKMGQTHVKKLMFLMGLPMILSMVLQALYNIVDSVFIANMPQHGEAALNALTLAFPMQMLMVAVSIGTGVGTNALVAQCLGHGDKEKAGRTAGNAQFLALIIYFVFLVFGVFGVQAYISSQTINTLVCEMATSYLKICCIFSLGISFFAVYEKLLQAAGHPVYSTIAQIAGAVSNIILDPILIYGWLGCPAYGVKGAAYATVIGQCVSWITALAFHLVCNPEIETHLKWFRPSVQIIRQIYAVGLAAIIAQALMSVMTYALNLILGTVSETMITAYGLYYKIQQFILFAAFGLRDAITPIVSFSYGMGSKSRINAGVRYGLLYTVCMMLAGMVAVELLALPLVNTFGLSGQTKGLCISAIRVISVSFVFAGVNIASQGVFQALEGGWQSLMISICRQILFVLPVAWGCARAVRQSNAPALIIWLSFPIAELATAAIAFYLLHSIWKSITYKILQKS